MPINRKKLGGIAWSGRKRHFGGSGTCKGAPHQKGKENMWQFERFVTEGNENVGELAKAGATLDEGFMAEARAKTVQQEREEVYAAMQSAPASIAW